MLSPSFTRRWRSRLLSAALITFSGLTLGAAEWVFDPTRLVAGSVPDTFQPALTGSGPPPKWQLVAVEATSQFESLTDRSTALTKQVVLTETSNDPTDERFPLLVLEQESFGDFTATLDFRLVGGRMSRMGGLAFRYQNPSNYYVLRASALGNTFRFYKVVEGIRSDPIGPELPIPSDTWHTLEVQCRGNQIDCRFNGAQAIPTLTDTTFLRGRLALWTKSDSQIHIRRLRVEYDAIRTLPDALVRRAMDQHPRLLSITIFGPRDGQVEALASSDPERVGKNGGDAEARALSEGQISAGSTRDHAAAVFPLRDRNGDALFAVRLHLRTFAGQTDNNIAARGRLILNDLEQWTRSADPDNP
jgi:hypothetical protein